MVITDKTFRLIKRIYNRYKIYSILCKFNSDRIAKDGNNKIIGQGLSDERYELNILELTHP